MSDYYVNLTTYVGMCSNLTNDISGWVENGWVEIRNAFTEFGTNIIMGSNGVYVDEVGRIVARSTEYSKTGVHRMVRLITVIHNWVRRGR